MPCSAEIGVDDRAEAFGIADRHALANRRQVQVAERKAVEPDAPAEDDVATAEPAGHLVDADAARVERDPSVDRFERVRQREMTQPAVAERGAAPEDGTGERAAHLRLERGTPAAAKIAEESLQDAEVRVARGLDVYRLIFQSEPAVERELRSLTRETEAADLEDAPIERQLNGPIVLHAIVEQFEVELLDIGDDRELVLIGELADDAHRAADDCGRERRQAWHEEPDVGVERRLAEPHRQLGVHLGCERHPSKHFHVETRRAHLEVERQQVPEQIQLARQHSDAFVAGEQIVDDELDVVARLFERAGASCVELQAARQRRSRKRDAGQRLDRDARAVGVERVGAVPADVRRTGDTADAFLDVDVVETDARAFEAQR